MRQPSENFARAYHERLQILVIILLKILVIPGLIRYSRVEIFMTLVFPIVLTGEDNEQLPPLCTACHIIDPECDVLIVCQVCMCRYHQNNSQCAPDAPSSKRFGMPSPLPSHGATPQWSWQCPGCRECRTCSSKHGRLWWCRWCCKSICKSCDQQGSERDGGVYKCSECLSVCLNCRRKPTTPLENGIYCEECALDRLEGRLCPVCNISYADEEESEEDSQEEPLISEIEADNSGMIQCDLCDIWCHISCVTHEDEATDVSKDFTCPKCKSIDSNYPNWLPDCVICKTYRHNEALIPLPPFTPFKPTRWIHRACAQPLFLLQLSGTVDVIYAGSMESLWIRFSNFSIQLGDLSNSSVVWWSFQLWSIFRKGIIEDYQLRISLGAGLSLAKAQVLTPYPIRSWQESNIASLGVRLRHCAEEKLRNTYLKAVNIPKAAGYELVMELMRLVNVLKPRHPLYIESSIETIHAQTTKSVLISVAHSSNVPKIPIVTHLSNVPKIPIANLSPMELCRLSLRKPPPKPIKAKPIISVDEQASKKQRLPTPTFNCARTRPFERRTKEIVPTNSRHHQLVGSAQAVSLKENQPCNPAESNSKANSKKLTNLYPVPVSFRPGPDFGRYKSVTLTSAYRSLAESSRHGLRVAKSGIAGYGLYTERTYQPGELFIEYIGELVGQAVADRREALYNRHPRLGPSSCYLFRLVDDVIVDATWRGNAARFINHSCDPNCAARMFDLGPKGDSVAAAMLSQKILIVALRAIKAGEELTYDYMLSNDDHAVVVDDEKEIDGNRLPCYCGALNCRKWM